MNILVLNSGSSSLKFQLIETDLDLIDRNADRRLAHGEVERIGGAAILTFEAIGQVPFRSAVPVRSIKAGLDEVIKWLTGDAGKALGLSTLDDIHAIGHRVVHGGEHFSESVLVTDEVVRGIQNCIDLAPLHNPANLAGIQAARDVFSEKRPPVAVFDTAFHQTLPEHAFLYALPYQLYRRHGVRRYGFHGTSHRYVAYRYRTIRELDREKVNIITLHLGNGCSVTAIKQGRSVDTSMGLTPLEGLVMGTRSGDIDAAIVSAGGSSVSGYVCFRLPYSGY